MGNNGYRSSHGNEKLNGIRLWLLAVRQCFPVAKPQSNPRFVREYLVEFVRIVVKCPENVRSTRPHIPNTVKCEITNRQSPKHKSSSINHELIERVKKDK